MLDPHRHSVVELLLEYYHRQLVLTGHDVAAMREEMESMQASRGVIFQVGVSFSDVVSSFFLQRQLD